MSNLIILILLNAGINRLKYVIVLILVLIFTL